MTATNHAVTGALIGLAAANPILALPLAFASHFVLDSLPHFDPPGNEQERVGARRLRYQLLAEATACGLIVLGLALSRPEHWLVAAFSAFAAASPDLFWIPKFIEAQKGRNLTPSKNWFLRFHTWVQWKTGPKLAVVELAWFAVFFPLYLTKIL